VKIRKAVVYRVNARYHLTWVLSGPIGKATVEYVIAEENIVRSALIHGVKKRMRAAVRKHAEQHKIKNLTIYGLD